MRGCQYPGALWALTNSSSSRGIAVPFFVFDIRALPWADVLW